MKFAETIIDKTREFEDIIQDLASNDTVQKMKNFKQHYNTSCYEHCKHVAFYSFLICKKYHLDYRSVARAGMLHDLFLYDWREKQSTNRKGFHAFTHPKTALKNASVLFDLNEKEQDIILKHMWPITIGFPRYLESFVVTFVDKFCAIQESIHAYQQTKIVKLKTAYRYAYIFLSMLIILR